MKQPKGKFAGTVRVGEKGQIVIPKGVRDLLDKIGRASCRERV